MDQTCRVRMEARSRFRRKLDVNKDKFQIPLTALGLRGDQTENGSSFSHPRNRSSTTRAKFFQEWRGVSDNSLLVQRISREQKTSTIGTGSATAIRKAGASAALLWWARQRAKSQNIENVESLANENGFIVDDTSMDGRLRACRAPFGLLSQGAIELGLRPTS